jgi:probable F420-dependent oxidoreductase
MLGHPAQWSGLFGGKGPAAGLGIVDPVRPFRFGYQATGGDPSDVGRSARAAERAGFDVFQVGDHVGAEPSALLSLAAAALSTERIRLGTLVLNNDFHHPVPLAQELATLDHLSGGRLEVGLGAGHSFTEYAAMGQAFDPPAERKERLAESVEILRALLDGGPVTFHGAHYRMEQAATLAPLQEHVPLLVGVNGRAALAHAVRHADIVAVTMLGRTREDGQHHDVRWEASRIDDTVEWMRAQAGARWETVELHALVQAVVVTEDRHGAASAIAARTGMDVANTLSTPFLCIGTHAEIAQHLLTCRERWDFSYFSVRDIEAFAPVMTRLHEADNAG